MNAIELLTRQHREAEALFERLARVGAPERAALLEELAQRLTGHMEIEEQIFYPAAYEVDPDQIALAAAEHEATKPLLDRLMTMSLNDDDFASTLAELKRNVLEHVEEEETDLFERCRRDMTAGELDRLATEMEALLTAARAGAVQLGSDDESVFTTP